MLNSVNEDVEGRQSDDSHVSIPEAVGLILTAGEAHGAVEVHHVTYSFRAGGGDRWVREMQSQLAAYGTQQDAAGGCIRVERALDGGQNQAHPGG